MSNQELKIFISHDAEDKALAVAIKTFLESIFNQAEVFVSTRDLSGGEVWIKTLQKQLRQATVIIALVTSYSYENPWLFFESGAGFIEEKTIPLCVGEQTIETLSPPLSLLHARNLDEEGLESLANDIARLAGTRKPPVYTLKEETLKAVKELLHSRQSVVKKEDDDIFLESESSYDPELYKRCKALSKEVHALGFQAVLKGEGKFKIPDRSELELLSIDDLGMIASTHKLPFPFRALSFLSSLSMNLPHPDDPEWKKLSAFKQVDNVEEEILKFKKRYLSD